VTNGLLAAFGLNRAGTEKWPSFAPPGPAIGAVWVVLFAGMGATRWLARSGREAGSGDSRAVDILIALCLAYPFYTHAFGGHVTELAGNLITFGFAGWLVTRLLRRSIVAAAFVALVAAWIAFATVLVFALAGLNGWSA
jgi:tryptophan-rich sensory protein